MYLASPVQESDLDLSDRLNSSHLPNTFPTQESAIEAAIQAGRQKIDTGFERGSAVVNG
jgi:hypothetical protein